MSYLYGDSTPSDLEGNYIEFLRDGGEFCVQGLVSDQRIVQAKAQTRSLEHATVVEVERLQKLGPLVAKAFEGTPLGGRITDGAMRRRHHELGERAGARGVDPDARRARRRDRQARGGRD